MGRGINPALALAGIMLSGCLNTGVSGGDTHGTNAHAARYVQVMSKGFTITGPDGYCVDTHATRDTDDRAFAVLGSCAVISGNPRDAQPAKPAMLTASVIPAVAPLDGAALDRMTAFFSTAPGRSALARADDAGEVSVIDLTREDGLLLVHAEDGDDVGEVAGDYWRGVFEAGGHVVTVTVSGFRDAPLDEKSGARLARSFVVAIRRANGANATADPEDRFAGAGERLASFFNRLP